MDSTDQLNLIKIGVFINKKLPDIDINDFLSLEELRVYLNYELNIDILYGMLFTDVIKEFEK